MSNLYRPMRRKFTALILVGILLILSLAGCKKDDPIGETTLPPDTVETTSPPPSTVPPTQPPVPIMTGTVTAEELNIREGVGVKFDVVDKLVKDDTVEIYEQQDLNGVMWGRISNGWICLAYVHIDGADDKIPEPTEYILTDPISGTIIATELNVRSGPGTNHRVTTTLKYGQEIVVTEMDGNWGKTKDGWVNTFFVYFKDSMDAESFSAEVLRDGVNVRTGPGTGYQSIKKVNTGDTLTILKQVVSKDILWGYTGEGWICLDYVKQVDGT